MNDTVKVSNTLTRKKETLVPLTPGEIRIYVCGVTVYDLCHVGHARSAIAFDVIRRYLAWKGYRVRFVKNYTDIDDKIIRRANEEGVAATVVSERNIRAFEEDMAAIGVLPADVEPKATAHVPQMIALIERLLAGGFAYVIDGDVYFEIARFPSYGRLSGKNLEELLAGARVDVDERKRDPRDFALWKSTKPGEPSWDSPWGKGRPGWHIECSAMSVQYLGQPFDIHGGGEDLIFPHHECEIAQSGAGMNQPFVRYWIHNGFVNLGAEKMSKSLGNTLTIREIVKRHDAEALRFWLLGAHYRHPIEFSEDRLSEATRALDRLRGLAGAAEVSPAKDASAVTALAAGIPGAEGDAARGALARFTEAMDDDFNTPAALAALFDLSRELHRLAEREAGDATAAAARARAVTVLVALGRVLGLFAPRAAHGPAPDVLQRIEALVVERDAARKRREWQRSDELRTELQALGVTVEDTAGGTRWKWKGA